jgi:hypothetical protein
MPDVSTERQQSFRLETQRTCIQAKSNKSMKNKK